MNDAELRELSTNGESLGAAWDIVLPLLDRLDAQAATIKEQEQRIENLEQNLARVQNHLKYEVERIAKLEARIERLRNGIRKLGKSAHLEALLADDNEAAKE